MATVDEDDLKTLMLLTGAYGGVYTLTACTPQSTRQLLVEAVNRGLMTVSEGEIPGTMKFVKVQQH